MTKEEPLAVTTPEDVEIPASQDSDTAIPEDSIEPALQKSEDISSDASVEDKQKEPIDKSIVLKFVGMLAFFAIIAIVVIAMWPYITDIFSEGGVDRLVQRVRDAGPAGVFILLGMQLLQIIVAFIPGEVVQLAAGLMYGPLLGALIILIGCVISSAIVYKIVRTLGAPFVRSMVSTEHLEKFQAFEATGKLDIIVFILFVIPGMPKDVFTYLVPLTDMPIGRFLLITTIARIPGVLASTYVAHGFAEGQLVGPIAIAVIIVVIALVAVLFRDKIMTAFNRPEEHDK